MIGIKCDKVEQCVSYRDTLVSVMVNGNCWGNCDDKKFYCTKRSLNLDEQRLKIGELGFVKKVRPECPACSIMKN